MRVPLPAARTTTARGRDVGSVTGVSYRSGDGEGLPG
jgi:hypothetical protein